MNMCAIYQDWIDAPSPWQVGATMRVVRIKCAQCQHEERAMSLRDGSALVQECRLRRAARAAEWPRMVSDGSV